MDRHPQNPPLAKSPEDWDKMLDELEYEKIVRLIKRLPMTWYPQLLVEMVEAAYGKNVFVPGGASNFVGNVEKRMGLSKAPFPTATTPALE